MAKGASAEKAMREIRRRVPERLLQKFLEHADPESTRCCARLADSALVQVLRPHEGGHRQATDKVPEKQTEQNHALSGGPSRVRTWDQPVMSRPL